MSPTDLGESVVLCEGFDDRAFWAGWLLKKLNCQKWKPERNGDLIDPWGKPINRGVYGYSSPSGRLIRVIPMQGKGDLAAITNRLLVESATRPLVRLVMNRDADLDVTIEATGLTTIRSYEASIVPKDTTAALVSEYEIKLDPGGTVVALMMWQAADGPIPGVPSKQTLERLVCCSLAAAFPKRAGCVSKWLNSRNLSLDAGPKEHAWSYMAGWYADSGCDRFYQSLWEDKVVAKEMESRLRSSGAWAIAESLAK
jgi:hypothetical protein